MLLCSTQAEVWIQRIMIIMDKTWKKFSLNALCSRHGKYYNPKLPSTTSLKLIPWPLDVKDYVSNNMAMV